MGYLLVRQNTRRARLLRALCVSAHVAGPLVFTGRRVEVERGIRYTLAQPPHGRAPCAGQLGSQRVFSAVGRFCMWLL